MSRSSSAKHRRRDRGDGKGSVREMLRILRSMGLPGLNRRLGLLAFFAFLAGLAQAALLVVVAQFAVKTSQGSPRLLIAGHALGAGGIVAVAGALLVIFAGSSITAARINSRTSSSVLAGTRFRIVQAFFRASWPAQSEERLGHVQQLLTVNSQNAGDMSVVLANGMQAILTLMALLITAFIVSPVTAAVVLALGIVLSSVLRPLNQFTRRASHEFADLLHKLGTLGTEYTRLVREFRLLGVEDRAIKGMEQSSWDASISYGKMRLLTLLTPVLYQSVALGFVIVALAIVASQGNGDLGALAAVLLLILRALNYGSVAQSTSQQLRTYVGFLEKVESEVERLDSACRVLGASELPRSYELLIEDVSYTYAGGRRALDRISVSLPSGHVLGVVGRSGSGKTTLSEVILGMREPSEGTATIGGVAAWRVRKEAGESPIALVAQEPVLLQGSIASNIAFFRGLSVEGIEAAARAAHLHDEVLNMPDGYQTLVGERGAALSGGQRQRLAIARALAGGPRLLVLDEPTSALDARSEALVSQTIGELRGEVTTVVISHRLRTVAECDLLLVLDGGEVADVGQVQEVWNRPAFRRLAGEPGIERRTGGTSGDNQESAGVPEGVPS